MIFCNTELLSAFLSARHKQDCYSQVCKGWKAAMQASIVWEKALTQLSSHVDARNLPALAGGAESKQNAEER